MEPLRMTSGLDILLVTTDRATEKAVKSVLGKSGQMVLTGVCKDLSELRSFLSRKQIRAAIIDIDPDPSQVLFQLRTVLTAYPNVYVAVLCSSFTKELVLQAMQAGARHFLEKASIESELSKELQSLLLDGQKKGPSGGSQVISVFSAGGGCGATTVALNLANELRLSSLKPALVIDLDVSYGAISTYLGIRSQYGIADVLAHKGAIDKHLIQSSAYNYMQDYHVLASPASIETPRVEALAYENLAPACEACRDVYAYTLIDAPRLPGPTSIEVAGLSDVVLVVFQLTVKDVHSARLMVSTLVKSGVSSEKIVPVANRVKKRGPLVRFEDSKKAVGLNSCHPIRSDWHKAMKCVNQSRLLAQVVGRSSLRGDFRKLAAAIRAGRPNSRGKT